MKRWKYPRTMHIPSSPGATADDKILSTLDEFVGKSVIITEKMDGENTSVYSDGYNHARSLTSSYHESRSWLRDNASQWYWKLDENMRVCGENLYAEHSIRYNNLSSYFYAFSVWVNDFCLNWQKTKIILRDLGVPSVPVLYDGPFSESILEAIILNLDPRQQEGIVIRNADGFHLKSFQRNVAKWVRPGHVSTSEHWMHGKVRQNLLAADG